MATKTVSTTTEFTDYTPMPFGKYRGKALIDVPAHYLLYLYDEGCDHEALIKYITDNLAGLKKEAGRK
jgi:uncharacterized protein (DUF3820 family)